MASTRYRLDRSDACVNCTLMNPSLLRWLVRSAYHIPGSPCEDCFLGSVCYVCTINQALQTVKRRGAPHPYIGPMHNNIAFASSKESDPDWCLHCLTACCCSCCSMALISETALKMPCVFSCCCSNYCIMRNILRYQWHLQGTDVGDDCCLPICMCILAGVPGLSCLCAWPYFVCDAMSMWKEVGQRGYTGPYLSMAVTSNPLALLSSPLPSYQPVATSQPTAATPSVAYPAQNPFVPAGQPPAQQPMFLHNPVMLTLNSIGVSVLSSTNAPDSYASSQEVEVGPAPVAAAVSVGTLADDPPYEKA